MQNLIHYRKFSEVPDEKDWTADEYEGIDGLFWLINDSGAWTGPLKNWREDSKDFMSQVKNFDVVICAGGNCGMYPRFYANYFKKVYSWEPDPDNYKCLQMNCDSEQFELFNGAISNTTDKIYKLYNNNKKNVGTHRLQKDVKNANVEMYRIDDLNLEKIDLIHLDIEGHEPMAIEGAKETIKKHHPVIITEKAKGHHLLIELGYKEFKKLTMDTIYIYEGNS